MPVIAFPAVFVRPQYRRPAGVRLRFGDSRARCLKHSKRPRRTRLDVCVLTMSGSHRATLSTLTLYGASLNGGRRLNRRELLALRLPSGRRVKARVRWRFGRRCGVTFLAPVADFARLLSESGIARIRSGRRRLCAEASLSYLGQGEWARLLHRIVTRARRLSRQLLRWSRTL